MLRAITGHKLWDRIPNYEIRRQFRIQIIGEFVAAKRTHRSEHVGKMERDKLLSIARDTKPRRTDHRRDEFAVVIARNNAMEVKSGVNYS